MNIQLRAIVRSLICGRMKFSSQIADLGSGVGKGGGGGGSIRAAGGGLGKIAAVNEEQYFRKKQMDQLEILKSELDSETSHQKENDNHEDAPGYDKEQVIETGKE